MGPRDDRSISKWSCGLRPYLVAMLKLRTRNARVKHPQLCIKTIYLQTNNYHNGANYFIGDPCCWFEVTTEICFTSQSAPPRKIRNTSNDPARSPAHDSFCVCRTKAALLSLNRNSVQRIFQIRCRHVRSTVSAQEQA